MNIDVRPLRRRHCVFAIAKSQRLASHNPTELWAAGTSKIGRVTRICFCSSMHEVLTWPLMKIREVGGYRTERFSGLSLASLLKLTCFALLHAFWNITDYAFVLRHVFQSIKFCLSIFNLTFKNHRSLESFWNCVVLRGNIATVRLHLDAHARACWEVPTRQFLTKAFRFQVEEKRNLLRLACDKHNKEMAECQAAMGGSRDSRPQCPA